MAVATATATATAAAGNTTGVSGVSGGPPRAGVLMGDGGQLFRVTPSPEHVVVVSGGMVGLGIDSYVARQQRALQVRMTFVCETDSGNGSEYARETGIIFFAVEFLNFSDGQMNA